ncbi:MAG: hypothetical protein A2233_04800 [Candidatus Kerfeldbacteria bacterium RIFOXYA2_FULL_38_24]|uniref:DUF721 domain-containing protein n=1 Tax=Candidatus Kerfeldbacteria bacterium RIFOXYB2_FULL_38_14 TaxID=1798547 RepID=A0A1G2BFN7_9BACT|nr:MAG: hypothetical protein A2319_02280 [Candidatus Kerfeldbacteria bacterium RIFOXYB2_FULL_38_14]OGY88189.1 MAG: hypothetical protein A2233_04800 [Candidatus Kerfeldbacteria bacterium RIFOXYA2_FULL_38_24]OGY89209.1 MAG: hypothetical protein A2458_01275 [Candidatus Kerfeldbacteria bacterium RIFOXYC2_FULL_38_9]
MFKKAGFSFFTQKLKKAGIEEQIEAVLCLKVVTEVLEDFFGKGFYEHAKPCWVKKRTLLIEIVHPAVGEQIRLQESAILFEINKKLKKAEVVKIQFKTN